VASRKHEGLKIFVGFSLEVAEDMTGLKKSEIDSLRRYGVVGPGKTKQGYLYSFVDLLMLRLVKQLRLNDVTLKNIGRAHEYIADIDPTKNLSGYKLYVRTDTREIVFFGDQDSDNDKRKLLINASEFGQLLHANVLLIIPVGKQLEKVRKTALQFDTDLNRSMQQKQVIPLDTLLSRHGLA
jgi:hypothetical protein